MTDDADSKVRAEWDVAFEGPALSINRYFLVSTGGNLRIAFCEQQEPGRPLHYRTAVIMPHAEALALADLIKGFLKPIGQPEKTEQSNG
jgi:hypothetical protein